MSDVQLVPENTEAEFYGCKFYIVGEDGQVREIGLPPKDPAYVSATWNVKLTVQSMAVKDVGGATIGYRKVKPKRIGEIRVDLPGDFLRTEIRALATAKHTLHTNLQIFLVTKIAGTPFQMRIVIPCEEWQSFMGASFTTVKDWPGVMIEKGYKQKADFFTLPLQEADIGIFLPVGGAGETVQVKTMLGQPVPDIVVKLDSGEFNSAIKQLQGKLKTLASDFITDNKASLIGPGGVPKPQSNPHLANVQPVKTTNITASLGGVELSSLDAINIPVKPKIVPAVTGESIVKALKELGPMPPKPGSLFTDAAKLRSDPAYTPGLSYAQDVVMIDELAKMPLADYEQLLKQAQDKIDNIQALTGVPQWGASKAAPEKAAPETTPVKQTSTKRVFDTD